MDLVPTDRSIIIWYKDFDGLENEAGMSFKTAERLEW